MRVEAAHLRFVAPLHVGDGPLERAAGLAPADTLFGGLCAAVEDLYGPHGLGEWLARFRGDDPPFVLSSLMPAVGEELFLPYPRHLAAWLPPDRRPAWPKGVRYVSRALFEALCRGDGEAVARLSEGMRELQDGAVIGQAAGVERLWAVDEPPRVMLDRRTLASTLFSYGRLRLLNPVTAVVLVAGRRAGDPWAQRLPALLRVLGSRGLGGERSIGNGQFDFLGLASLELEVPRQAAYFVLLSPFFPRPEEARSLRGWYTLRRRQGWVGIPGHTTLRGRAYRHFAEGSVFEDHGERGGLLDVTPAVLEAPRLFRYGWAFKVPARGPGDALGG